jgi:hypothetical protein
LTYLQLFAYNVSGETAPILMTLQRYSMAFETRSAAVGDMIHLQWNKSLTGKNSSVHYKRYNKWKYFYRQVRDEFIDPSDARIVFINPAIK